MTKLRVLDLFSGIGGFSLGLERAVSDGPYTGFETVAFCEIEPFPRKVLAKHWPEVPQYDDVRTLTAKRLAADGIAVDLICGGYPCQPFSTAGRRMGDKDDRHLWPEVHRLLDELRPDWFIGENVAGHVSMGLDEVLSDLEAINYTARPFVIPACAADAPHRRDRVWIVANARCSGLYERRKFDDAKRQGSKSGGVVGHGFSERVQCETSVMANATSQRQQGHSQPIQRGSQAAHGEGQTNKPLTIRLDRKWPTEPDVGRVANGVSKRMDRLKSLGNAVVPQIPEIIGNAILESMKCT